jgi:hypothetical protein
MFWRSPKGEHLRGLSDEGFKRLAKDLYDHNRLQSMHEIFKGPAMNVFIDREDDSIDVWIRGDLAETLRTLVRTRTLEDEYR